MNNECAISLLRDPKTIRERSQQLYERALAGNSLYFGIDESKISPCCELVLSLAKKDNPNLVVPFHSRWRHFSIGNIDRIEHLKNHNKFPQSTSQQGRLWYELIIISVLLDAGAGNKWSYQEKSSGQTWNRSEGLAIASIDMFSCGLFSSDKNSPLQADYNGLKQINAKVIGHGMQVNDDNPLNGLEGRAQLINLLATVIETKTDVFNSRLGDFYDHVVKNSTIADNTIDAAKVLALVLETFSQIWPGRISIDNKNLGDVWRHSAIKGEGITNGLIPFHKLSQWLTYSLLEPLQWQGYRIEGLDKMTGLAEYRNGGLLIDTNVITVKQPILLTQPQEASSEAVIEWRALTICLLDILWQQALVTINQTPSTFPLVSFLEAGTWKAGRVCAKQRNSNANPPITIISDGTVF